MPRFTGSSSSMISIARTLGAPTPCPPGKARAARPSRPAPRAASLDVGDDVHHMRIALDHHVLGDAHAAGLRRRGRRRCAPGRSASRARRAPSGRPASSPRAPRPSAVLPRGRVPAIGRTVTVLALQPHQYLGRGADHVEVAQVEIEHVGRGIDACAAPGTATAAMRENGSDMRCDSTTCMTSPSKM